MAQAKKTIAAKNLKKKKTRHPKELTTSDFSSPSQKRKPGRPKKKADTFLSIDESVKSTLKAAPPQQEVASYRDEQVNNLFKKIFTPNPISPSHYEAGGYKCRHVQRALGLSLNVGTAFKYLWRAGRKPDNTLLQDLKKAREYLNFEIEYLENPGIENMP